MDDPELGFARIASVDVDREGDVYVFEAQDMQIRVYSPDGALLRKIGGRGEGPGEFNRFVPSFQVVGDTLWAFDAFPRRVTLFDRQGAVLATNRIEGVTVPLQDQDGVVLPRILRPDGRFVGELMMYMGRQGPSPVGERDTVQVPFVLFDFDGRAVDTLGFFGRPPPESQWRDIEAGGGRVVVPSPPSAEPIDELVTDGRILVDRPLAADAEPAAFAVIRVTFEGDTVYHRVFGYRPLPWSDASLDSIAARGARRPGGVLVVDGRLVPQDRVSDTAEAAETIRDALDFPPFQSPARSVRISDDEGLWLQREELDPFTNRWLILDAEGAPLGLVDLPSETRILWSRGLEFWAAETDDLEVPWLVHYRLEAEEGP